MSVKVVVLHGDSRQGYLAKEWAKKGAEVYLTSSAYKNDSSLENIFDKIAKADILIGAIPMTQDQKQIAISPQVAVPFEEVLRHLHAGQWIAAGCIPESFAQRLKEKKVLIYDVMKDETTAYYNAIATAEGAIAEAILHSPYQLFKSKCLIVGYGRCGSVLAQKLVQLGADVTVCTRDKTALARAYLNGCTAFPLSRLPDIAGEFLFCFSTAPARVFSEEILKNMKKNVLLIDIASQPGGVDFASAQKLGIEARHCLGLPGKYSPASAAHMLLSSYLSHIPST